MKTDHPIYLFLRSGPEAFRVLTGGRRLKGPYNVCSLSIKGIERRLDDLFDTIEPILIPAVTDFPWTHFSSISSPARAPTS